MKRGARINNGMDNGCMITLTWIEARETVRMWLESKIKCTRGMVLSVKAKQFFTWLGRSSFSAVEAHIFWRLVDEIAPQLGLKPIPEMESSVRRIGGGRKRLFIIGDRASI